MQKVTSKIQDFCLNKFFVAFTGIFIAFNTYSQVIPKWDWATRILTIGQSELHDIETDGAGNIYIAGKITSGGWKIILGQDTFPADGYHEGFFIAKFDSTGKIIWGKPTGGGLGHNGANSLAIDNEGNLYVCGYSESASIIFGKDTLSEIGKTEFPQKDIIIVKYNLHGNILWAKRGGSLGQESADAICIGSDGQIYVAGKFSRKYNFKIDSFEVLPGIGDNYDIFWMKMDADGNIKWLKNAGGNNNQNEVASAIVADGETNLYITGYFESEIFYFGNTSVANTKWGERDIFVLKFDSAGNDVMALHTGGMYRDEARDICIDKDGAIYIAGGSYYLRFANDSFKFANAGGVLLKYAADGTPLWARATGGTETNISTTVAIDSSNNPIVAGCYLSVPVILGKDTLPNNGITDVFIAQYDSAGNVKWAKSAGGKNSDFASCVHVGSNNNIYLGGEIDGFNVAFDSVLLSSSTWNIFLAKLKFVPADSIEDSIPTAVIPIKKPFFKIYPNPASDRISIITTNKSSNTDIEIVDAMGKRVKRLRSVSCQPCNINVTDLKPGIYLLIIKEGDEFYTRKILIGK